jgi:hypothetical protein
VGSVVEWSGGGVVRRASEVDRGGGDEVGNRWKFLEELRPTREKGAERVRVEP